MWKYPVLALGGALVTSGATWSALVLFFPSTDIEKGLLCILVAAVGGAIAGPIGLARRRRRP
jgi:hypothetical protein